MKTKLLLLCLLISSPLSSLIAEEEAPLLLQKVEDNLKISVNNRILAKVNGKAISVIDVMKKMDMIFYRRFPEYASSKSARFQFYDTNWKFVLNELIDKELVLAEAEQLKMTVSNGDIRKELDSIFGPDLITNLDKAELTYDEAWKMIETDMILRRMMLFRVNMKAMSRVTPKDIQAAYAVHSMENIQPAEWTYRVISIRDKDIEKNASAAKLVYQLLKEGTLTAEDFSAEALQKKPKQLELLPASTQITLSEEYHHTEKEISPLYKEVLISLSSPSYSEPIEQKSRADNSTFYRIFYLKEKKEGGVISLDQMEGDLREFLTQQEIAKESEVYLSKLRRHFGITEEQLNSMVPENFKPFSLN
jgi:hypothetical protein